MMMKSHLRGGSWVVHALLHSKHLRQVVRAASSQIVKLKKGVRLFSHCSFVKSADRSSYHSLLGIFRTLCWSSWLISLTIEKFWREGDLIPRAVSNFWRIAVLIIASAVAPFPHSSSCEVSLLIISVKLPTFLRPLSFSLTLVWWLFPH